MKLKPLVAMLFSMALAAYATQALAMGDRPASAGRMSDVNVDWHAAPIALPDVDFLDNQNREWRLSHFQGQVVMLNFWAGWCPPCVQEMPAFDRMQANYGARGLRIIPVSQDRPTPEKSVPQKIAEFYQHYNINSLGQFYAKDTITYATLRIPGLPTTLLIDRHGRERARIKGQINWEGPEFRQQLESLLNER